METALKKMKEKNFVEEQKKVKRMKLKIKLVFLKIFLIFLLGIFLKVNGVLLKLELMKKIQNVFLIKKIILFLLYLKMENILKLKLI